MSRSADSPEPNAGDSTGVGQGHLAARRLETLAFAAAGFARAQTEQDIFDVLKKSLEYVLDVDTVLLGLYDADQRTLRYLATTDAGVEVPGEATFPVAGTPAESVIRSRHPLVTGTASDPRNAGAVPMGTGRRSESAIRCPVLADDEVLAVLSVQSYTPDAYGPDELGVVEVMSGHAATALLNLRYRRELSDTLERERSARQALERSAERHAAMLEHAHDLTAVLDRDGIITYVSPSCRRILGRDPEEVVGLSVFSFLRGTQRDEAADRFVERLAGTLDSNMRRFDFPHRDGSWRTLELVGQNLVDHPAIQGVIFNARDVTDRRDAERKRDDALRRLRTAQRVARIGDWDYDLVTGVLTWSDELFHIFGVPLDAHLDYQTYVGLIHPDDRETVTGTIETARRRGRPYTLDHRIVRRDGTVRYLHCRGLFEAGDDGTVIRAYGTSQDITELRRTEEALRSAQHRMRLFLNQMPALLWMTDRDLRFTWADGAGLQAIGQAPSDHKGITLYDYFETDDDGFLPIAKHVAALEGESASYEQEWLGRTFATHVEPLRDEDGAIIGTLGFSVDVSDRIELEERLRDAQRMESIGRLAGGVAHDFNNILTVIDGHANLLLDQIEDGDPARADLEDVREAAARAASLTRQLLAFSRRQVLRPRILDVNEAVRSMERMLERLIGEDIVLETDLTEDASRVSVDPSQLEQVLMNLAVNARDAMPGGGRLTLVTRREEIDEARAATFTYDVAPGDYVRIEVADTGEGMAPDVAHRAFEPFFTTKGEGQGTGLGLATVYGIVKQSDGYVGLETDPGQGTRFDIFLPVVDGDDRASRDDADSRPARGGSEVILLVEDELPVRSLARRVLERKGYTVVEAGDGEEALRKCRAEDCEIDLVLTDVVMPQMSGTRLVERIRAICPDIVPLFMSGYTEDEVLRRGVVADEVPFLQKPFTPADLARKVRSVLDAERAPHGG